MIHSVPTIYIWYAPTRSLQIMIIKIYNKQNITNCSYLFTYYFKTYSNIRYIFMFMADLHFLLLQNNWEGIFVSKNLILQHVLYTLYTVFNSKFDAQQNIYPIHIIIHVSCIYLLFVPLFSKSFYKNWKKKFKWQKNIICLNKMLYWYILTFLTC